MSPPDIRGRIVDRHGLGYESYGDPLAGIERAMAALGDPHESFATVHVTGTNGAGSVCDFVGAALHEAGYDVGLFSGLGVTGGVRAKYRINGAFPDADTLFDLADAVVDRVETRDEWDVLVAMAIEYFAREDIDVAVFEAGEGGRDDSTNVVESDLSVVTNIEVTPEHPDLGSTVEAVARRKAGIVDPGSVAVAGGSETARETVCDVASEAGATAVRARTPVAFDRPPGERTYVAEYGGDRVATRLVAPYECENVNTAVTALEAGPFAVSPAAVRRTLARFKIPGRCEFVGADPEYLLDGAHNPAGASALADVLAELDLGPVTMVFTAPASNWPGMLDHLDPAVDHAVLTEADLVEEHRGDPAEMTTAVTGTPTIERDPETAVERASERCPDDGTVLVTGALGMLEEVRPRLVGGVGAVSSATAHD